MKNRVFFRIKTAVSISSVLIFATLLVWFSSGMINAGRRSEAEQLRDVKQSVMNAAVLCYSVEGSYPDSVDYIKEHYGLRYDESRYKVDYGFVSSDSRPTVNVSVNN